MFLFKRNYHQVNKIQNTYNNFFKMVRFLIIVLPLFSVDFWDELVFFFFLTEEVNYLLA